MRLGVNLDSGNTDTLIWGPYDLLALVVLLLV